jgi:hypothetical protein
MIINKKFIFIKNKKFKIFILYKNIKEGGKEIRFKIIKNI